MTEDVRTYEFDVIPGQTREYSLLVTLAVEYIRGQHTEDNVWSILKGAWPNEPDEKLGTIFEKTLQAVTLATHKGTKQ